jgi:4,5-dihydroxyphthalate decarboxylase
MVTAFLPPAFFTPDYPLVHMIPDYKAAEQAYFKRVGYAPAHHIVVVKREVTDRHPWIARSLMTAFTAARRSWIADRRKLQDTSLWLLPDLEETAALFGEAWPHYGLEPNLKMLTDFCQDQYAQKLVTAPVDPVAAFADFTRMTAR